MSMPCIFSSMKKQIESSLQNTVKTILHNKLYSAKDSVNWNESITKQCIEEFQVISNKCKYIVFSIIMQKNGAGLHQCITCSWNPETDGQISYKWENESMSCICTVYVIAI